MNQVQNDTTWPEAGHWALVIGHSMGLGYLVIGHSQFVIDSTFWLRDSSLAKTATTAPAREKSHTRPGRWRGCKKSLEKWKTVLIYQLDTVDLSARLQAGTFPAGSLPAPSSSGLGHRVFIPATGVRVSVGSVPAENRARSWSRPFPCAAVLCPEHQGDIVSSPTG